MVPSLESFRVRLSEKMDNPFARPFVCRGSPYNCKAFIVGINAATVLQPFLDYWSDEDGFAWSKFKDDYKETGKKEGNRRPIEAISEGYGGALETNVCMRPSRKPKELTEFDWQNSLLPFLFDEFKPAVVFAHASRPIAYWEGVTGCRGVNMSPQMAEWMGHRFWLCGRPGALYTLGSPEAYAYGQRLKALDSL